MSAPKRPTRSSLPSPWSRGADCTLGPKWAVSLRSRLTGDFPSLVMGPSSELLPQGLCLTPGERDRTFPWT